MFDSTTVFAELYAASAAVVADLDFFCLRQGPGPDGRRDRLKSALVAFETATAPADGTPSARELADSLRETLRALESHLDDDTVHAKLSHRDHLCPCNQNEVARAKALLARIDGKAR